MHEQNYLNHLHLLTGLSKAEKEIHFQDDSSFSRKVLQKWKTAINTARDLAVGKSQM